MKLTATIAILASFASAGAALACPMQGHADQTAQSPILVLPPITEDGEPTADS